jgi:hypothetical protein
MSQPLGNPPLTPPPKKSGLSTFMIVLLVFGVIGLVCCGGCIIVGWMAGRTAGPAALMGAVLPAVEGSPQVQEKFGSPIQPISLPTSPKVDFTPGATSSVDFEISGPKGRGKVHAEVTMTPNSFEAKVIQVTAPDGSTFNISGEKDPTDITIPDIPAIEMEEESK